MDDGYFEGRLPFPIVVDERWYLEQIPMLRPASTTVWSPTPRSISTRTAIARGVCLSACSDHVLSTHCVSNGLAHGRAQSASFVAADLDRISAP